jgi:hypothetical protein
VKFFFVFLFHWVFRSATGNGISTRC